MTAGTEARPTELLRRRSPNGDGIILIHIPAFVDLGHDPTAVYPRRDDAALVCLPLEVVQLGDNPGEFGGLKEPGRVFRPLGVIAEGFEAPVGAHPAPDAAGVPLPHEARQHKGVDPARGQAAVDD